ncbi:MAG TPA: type II secretion system F family protein [Polyangiaceae bacterium]|nr:type II secretion system F family protein [Polyangiaceae bacterium]
MNLLLHVHQVVIALCVGSTVLVAAYAVLDAPHTTPSFLGPRGLQRGRALSRYPAWNHAEPAVRWLGARLRPFMRRRTLQSLDNQITLSGDFLGLQPEEFVSLSVLSCLFGLSLGALYGLLLGRGALYMVLSGALAAALPFLQLSGLVQERRRRVQNGLPYVIDLLSLGLSAGLDFPGSLRQVIEKASTPDDPLLEELNLILEELRMGKTRKEALVQFATRVPGESVREFVGAVIQAEERGNPLARVLQIQAESSRQRRSVRAEEAASRASLQILMPMVMIFVAILLLIVTPMAMGLKAQFQ